MTRSKFLLPLAACLLALGPVAARAQMLEAHVREGTLAGARERAVSAFLGIPYAAPPVGANRWRPPAPPSAWSGVRQASQFSASCQQTVGTGGFGPWTHEYVVSGAVSEDCLYLNVWTPAQATGDRLPVLVWIHGGGFSGGSASVPIYDGAKLAAQGIVVIGINYRLGLYGFMAHPALSAESPVGASGNYGLLDQIAALKWIKANVAAFGGDPDRITIAGQSAGAASVHHLIASPLARGLFARAIAQSGSGMGLAVPDRTTAEQRGVALMQAAGVTGIAQLRALSAAQLDAALGKMMMGAAPAGGLPFAPIIDGLVLPDAGYAGANINDTPILTGMTADEMTGLDPTIDHASSADVTARIERDYGALAPEVLKLYPAATDAQANATVRALARDRGLASMALWAEQRQKTSRHPIYAYLWTHWEPGPDAARYRAFHSSEIPYVFGTLDASPERPFTDEDQRLSDELSGYWVNWVKTGDPNGPGLSQWPVFQTDGEAILEIGTRTMIRPILAPERLRIFREHVARGGTLGLF